jgi:pyochelin synthetase
MNRNELLIELDKRGVKLWVQNDKLSIEAPKGVLTKELFNSLVEHKIEIMRLLRLNDTKSTSLPIIEPDFSRRYEPFPLTDIQQAHWVGRSSVFELGNVANHHYLEFEVSNLDLSRLAAAWQKLIERHDMLRAIVLPTGEQQILEQVPAYEIATLDLRGLEKTEVEAQLTVLREKLSHQVLPSQQWPWFDIRATYLDNQRIRIHISMDLLVVDAASIRIVFQEWNKLYQKPDLLLPPLDLSFRDYVINKNALQDLELIQQSQDYWFSRLDTLPPAPELPLACFPSELKEYQFKRYRAELSPNIWQQLKQRGQNAGLTPSVILLAAFAEVLTVWSKNPHFIINLTVLERLPIHPQINQIVGDFTNTNLLAVDNSIPDTFIARALQIQQQLLQDLDHLQISGVEVLRELARRQKTGLTAAMPIVFSSVLGLSSFTQGDLEFSFLGEIVYGISQTPQVSLDYQVTEQNGALIFNWDVVEELFPDGLLDDMFGAYCDLLQKLAKNDQVWYMSQRSLLPTTQLKQRIAVNATDKPIPETALLHTLVFQQVSLRPQQMAVITSDSYGALRDRTLTYLEVGDRAINLAHHLQQLRVSPNKLVAIVMDKGWEQVVAALGILAAGAAYLPIDPGLPTERLWYLLKQAKVQIVLTQTRLESLLDWPENIQRICIDADIKSLDNHFLETVVKPEDLAYIIYTSGSTGMPKGVMISHQSVVNTILDINQRFDVNADDRILALSSLSFDLSVYDIFGTLAAGGTIIIPEAASTKDPNHWTELITRYQITIWNSVPALMQMLVEYASHHPEIAFNNLRLVLLSGDWIPLSLPQQVKGLSERTFKKSNLLLALATGSRGYTDKTHLRGLKTLNFSLVHGGGLPCGFSKGVRLCSSEFYSPNTFQKSPEKVKVISLGGATEASIWSIIYPIEDATTKSIPYGRPMANQRFYVLKETLEPCPVWVPGHLYIGGIGLAKGYWCDEEKTQASFIIHPESQERLYKTGDWGRYLPDGNIEFLGRDDFQVKINGYRIELGEIEVVLQQHTAIKEAIANVLEEQGNKSLIGYIVPKPEKVSEINFSELRHFLQTKLPEYMIPSTFMLLESLPLTANGKVNRQALPAPSKTPELEKTLVRPRNQTDETLISIWAEVFQLEQLGINDNFFELGGHSFLALQLIAKIHQKLGKNIALSTLFQYPTVAGLANSLIKNTAASVLVPIRVEGTQPPLFCIHPSGGQVMVYQHLAACLDSNQPIYGLQSRNLNNSLPEYDSIDDMAVEYTKVIRQHQPNSPYYLMGWSMGGVLAVSVAKELEQQEQEVAFVGLVDAFLIPNNIPNFERDRLQELGLVFGETFADILMNLDNVEQQTLQDELIGLSAIERLRRIIIWGQEKNLLATDISVNMIEKQVHLTEIHEQMLRVHHPPQIQAQLYIWEAMEQFPGGLSRTDWSQYTTNATYTEIVDANHFTIMRPPNIQNLAQKLQQYLQDNS